MRKRVLLLLCGICLLALFGCAGQEPPQPSDPPAPTADHSQRGEIITTAAPGDEPAPAESSAAPSEPTPAPPETAPETAPPATAAPTATPPPTAAPAAVGDPAIDRSGSFRSDTGTALNLVADWRAVSSGADTVKLTVTVSLESYSLDVGERRGNTLTFNGMEVSFMTDPVEIDGGFAVTPIFIWSKEIPVSELSFTLSVKWNLLGSYSGVEIESLELSGSYVYAP